MEIRFLDRSNDLTQNAREMATRRLRFALSRFGREIQHVTVIAEDVNGPRVGGKRCTVRAKIRPGDAIEASDEGFDISQCLAKAVDRVGRSVARKLEMSRRFGRDSVRAKSGLT